MFVLSVLCVTEYENVRCLYASEKSAKASITTALIDVSAESVERFHEDKAKIDIH